VAAVKPSTTRANEANEGLAKGRRYEELDALRGLAALTVVAHHHLSVFPLLRADTHQSGNVLLNLFKYSPLHIVWAGGEAVLLFFVLSGFVLALPALDAPQTRYRSYLVRRIARIYPPYLLAVLLGFVACVVCSRDGIASLSDWFNGAWRAPYTTGSFVKHLLLVPSFDNGQYDPVLWSLVHEMRISIIFPLVVILVARTSWKTSLLVGLVVNLATIALDHLVRGSAQGWDYLVTGRYIILFVGGALLAKHRAHVVARYRALPTVARALLLLLAAVLYSYGWVLQDVRWLHVGPLDGFAIGLGSAIFITAALGSTSAGRALRSPVMRFAGRISYSLYLLHAVVLLTVVNLFYGKAPLWALLLFSGVAGIALATLAHRWVEAPSIRLGRRMATAVERTAVVTAD
jgi:peptidoglycan/LPS O-acetylase OafA/YrhL